MIGKTPHAMQLQHPFPQTVVVLRGSKALLFQKGPFFGTVVATEL